MRGMREDRELLSHEPDSMFACNGKQHLILHGDDCQVESDKKLLWQHENKENSKMDATSFYYAPKACWGQL